VSIAQEYIYLYSRPTRVGNATQVGCLLMRKEWQALRKGRQSVACSECLSNTLIKNPNCVKFGIHCVKWKVLTLVRRNPYCVKYGVHCVKWIKVLVNSRQINHFEKTFSFVSCDDFLTEIIFFDFVNMIFLSLWYLDLMILILNNRFFELIGYSLARILIVEKNVIYLLLRSKLQSIYGNELGLRKSRVLNYWFISRKIRNKLMHALNGNSMDRIVNSQNVFHYPYLDDKDKNSVMVKERIQIQNFNLPGSNVRDLQCLLYAMNHVFYEKKWKYGMKILLNRLNYLCSQWE